MLSRKEELPDVELVRSRILKAKPEQAKFGLMAEYLFCARASEIVGRKCPSDITTTPRGLTGKDLEHDVFEIADTKHDVIVFTLHTAKRDGKVRKIALPLDSKYEPFTEPLLSYIKDAGNKPAFNYTRQKQYEFAQLFFNELEYKVETYTKKPFDSDAKREKVKAHFKPFRTHALRHLRTAELLEVYGFSGIDLSTYGGWTLRSTIGVGSSLDRYAHLNWRRYFPKLLRSRT